MLKEIGYASREVGEGMDNPLDYWATHLDHYDPEVMLRPENLEEAFHALVAIDHSHSATTVASFIHRSAIALGWDGNGISKSLSKLLEQGLGA